MIKFLTENFFVFIFIFFASNLSAQTNISGVINDYYVVNTVDVDSNFVIVDSFPNLNEGDGVLLIQMQGAVIDESQSSSFGNITDYSSAGNYEFQTVCHIDGTKVYFQNTVLNVYNPNEAVQLVFVPHYSSAILVDTLTGLPWDGSMGGVLVLDVDSVLDMNNFSVTMSAKGFQGAEGAVSGDDCSWLGNAIYTYYQNFETEPWSRGRKGEGVAKIISGKECGIGPQANGGGGGNNHNGGAGGGSNYGVGGRGGERINATTFSCTAPEGLPSISLNNGYNNNKIFLGGGGGAGHGNNEGISGESGGNGGGIIFILASEVVANNQSIVSNGESVVEGSTDGGAGGGAGGTVVLDVDTVIGNLFVEVNGGGGASTINGGLSNCNGPGGGGGGGAVLVSLPSVPASVSSSFEGGESGIIAATDQGNCVVGSQNLAQNGTPGAILTGWSNPLSLDESIACEPPCLLADLPVFDFSIVDICEGEETVISIVDGNLNGADNWVWHINDCEGNVVGTGDSLSVVLEDDVAYYVAGEGGCLTSEIPSCGLVQIFTHPSYESSALINLCEGDQVIFNGETITEAGLYSMNLLTEFGCDSIVSLVVTTTSIDNGIVDNESFLTATQEDAAYQWINCVNDSVFQGETNMIFYPPLNGEFAVVVTLDNCSELSDCVNFVGDVSLDEMEVISDVVIYPNPAQDFFVVSVPLFDELLTLTLSNTLGQEVLIQDMIAFENNRIDVSSLTTGVYFGCIYTNSIQRNFKLVVE